MMWSFERCVLFSDFYLFCVNMLRLETQSAGSITLLIILFLTILSSSCFMVFINVIETFLCASMHCYVFMESFTDPGIEPFLSTWSEYMCVISSIVFICVKEWVYCAFSFLTVQCKVINLSCSSDSSPKTGVPCTSTIWKVLLCQSESLFLHGMLTPPLNFIGVCLYGTSFISLAFVFNSVKPSESNSSGSILQNV